MCKHKLAKKVMNIGLVLTIIATAFIDMQVIYNTLYLICSSIYMISFWLNRDYASIGFNAIIWGLAAFKLLHIIFG